MVGPSSHISANYMSICAGDGKVEAGDDGPAYVGLAVPYHFLCLIFLFSIGGLSISEFFTQCEVWLWVLPIHPRGVGFEGVDDISLYFSCISEVGGLFGGNHYEFIHKINDQRTNICGG